MCSWLGKLISAANRPWPFSSGPSSLRSTERPTYFALASLMGPDSASRQPHLDGGGADRLDDVLVAGAAAQIRRENIEQVLVADVRLALQHADRQQKAARGAAHGR